MQRRTTLAALALAGSATLIAACGSGSSGGSTATASTNNASQSPSDELTGAVSALGDASTLSTTLKLDTTAADLRKLAAQSGDSLTTAQASAIAGAQVVAEVAAPSGKTVSDLRSGDTSGAAVDLTVSDNGTNLLSLRAVNKTLYLQADVKDLLDTIGKSSLYTELQSKVGQLPPFAQAAFAGKWVSLPESAASSLGALGAAGGASSPSPQQVQTLLDAVKSVLTEDVTVTRTSTGTTDHLTLSANSRTIARDLVSKITATLPQAGNALGSANPDQVPSRNVAMTAQVTNGALSQLAIDLGQFDPNGTTHLPVTLDFSRGGAAITAPANPVPVNTQELALLFSQLGGGFGAAGLGPSVGLG